MVALRLWYIFSLSVETETKHRQYKCNCDRSIFFPEGSAMSRTVAKVAEERMASLREYLEALMKLDAKYLSSDIMEEFFAVNDDDLLFMKNAEWVYLEFQNNSHFG